MHTSGVVTHFGSEATSPQSYAARHGLLQVRVAGQGQVRVAGSKTLQRLRHLLRACGHLAYGVPQIKPQRCEHLVVSRTPQMNAAASFTSTRY